MKALMLVAMVGIVGCGGRALDIEPNNVIPACGGISQECCKTDADPCDTGLTCKPSTCPPHSTCDDGQYNQSYARRYFFICDTTKQ
jgi:hypothetical protein